MPLVLIAFGYLLAVLLVGIVSLIIYARWNYGTLEALGIPVVKPFLFFGSNYNEYKLVLSDVSIERLKKYGQIYGAYDGRTPQIFISDPKLIRLITTAHSDSFRNHGFSNVFSGTIPNLVLDLLNDEKWKTVRSALTPIFTTAKLKQLNKITQEYSTLYFKELIQECNEQKILKFEAKEFCTPLVLEILSKAFCGIEIKNARAKDNEFIKQMRMAMFDFVFEDDWKSYNFYKIFPILFKLFNKPEVDGMDFFVTALKSVLESRINSHTESIDAANTFAEMIKKVRANDEVYTSLGIDENTVLAQAWVFFLAGFSTIQDTITALVYELSKNPEVQEKILAEVTNEEKVIDPSNMPYTTACINEALRLYATFERPDRLCNRTWTHEGLTIPKGISVVFPMAGLHQNPELYPEPQKYRPERFLEKESRDIYSFFGFGHGPRSCPGNRFALDLIKIVMGTFLIKFRIVERRDTKLEKYPGGGIIMKLKPSYVDLVLR